MAPDWTNSPKSELDEISNMSVSSFLSRCDAIVLKLENDILKEAAVKEAKEFLWESGVFLLWDDITSPGIELPEKIQGLISSLMEEYNDADELTLLKAINGMKKVCPEKLGNLSLDDIVWDMLYAQEIFKQAIVFQITAFYPLENPTEEVVDESRNEADDALRKKSYADLELDELHKRFEFLTIEKRGRAIQACVDKGWITKKDAEKIIIHEKEGYISVGLLDIEMDDFPEKQTFSETANDDSPDAADWEIVSRMFVSEIEILKKERRDNKWQSDGDVELVRQIEVKISELEEERDIAINFFIRNVLNMREREYLVTRRWGSYIDPKSGFKEITPSTMYDYLTTVSFYDGFKRTNNWPTQERIQSLFQHTRWEYKEIQWWEKFPVRRKYKPT